MFCHTDSAIYARALALHESGDSDSAIDELKKELRKDGDNGRLWELLGTLAYARKDYALAQSATEEASVRVPLSVRSQLVLGKCYDLGGHRKAAAAIYRHIVSIAELDIDILESLASGLGRCGELELALQVCRNASRMFPDDPAPLIGMAHYMLRLGRPVDRVLPIMFRAHQLDPNNAEYRIMLAWLLYKTGCPEDAVYLLEALPREKFRCISCLTRMERIFSSVGKHELAIECQSQIDRISQE